MIVVDGSGDLMNQVDELLPLLSVGRFEHRAGQPLNLLQPAPIPLARVFVRLVEDGAQLRNSHLNQGRCGERSFVFFFQLPVPGFRKLNPLFRRSHEIGQTRLGLHVELRPCRRRLLKKTETDRLGLREGRTRKK